MRPRKLLASTAICGVVIALAACETPTEGQKAAREATQPSVTVIQPTTVTKTCEEPCTSAHASAPSAGTPATTTTTDATSPTASLAYSRDQFGNGWADPDGNGCDGRQDAVARATTDQHRTSRCYIATGDVTDWYTGKVCNDCPTRGFDVDHVVALADAWRSGASKWTRAKRIRYANDPLVLVLTNASLNRSKSDQGPDQWAPVGCDVKVDPQCGRKFACKYVRRYRQIKLAWGLHSTTGQRAAIRRTLATC
jgi:hypothetical protein